MDRAYAVEEWPEGWAIVAEPVLPEDRFSWVLYWLHPTRDAAVAHLLDVYGRQRALLEGVASWKDRRSH